MNRRLRTLSPLLLAPFLFTGCAAMTSSAPESWVKADRATKDAIAPEYLEYVDKDDALDQAGKDRRHRTVQTWETRLAEHEQTLAKPAQ
jgi:hypothetical protein